MADDHPLLIIRVSGPGTDGGRLPLTEFARIAGEFQATVERIALGIRGLQPMAGGRRPRNIVDSVAMDIRAFTSGSAVLSVGRMTEPRPDDDLLGASLETLEVGLAAIAGGQPPPDAFTVPVLDGLLRLSSGVADKTVSTVEIQRDERATIVFNRKLRTQVRAARRSIDVSIVEHGFSGVLQMGDFAPSALRCRIDTLRGGVSCRFSEELACTVLAAMGALVWASGFAEFTADGSIRSFDLREIEVFEKPPLRTIGDLAAEQGVTPLKSLDELKLSEPLSDEEREAFLAAVREARGGWTPE
jgi:hypothetical protein